MIINGRIPGDPVEVAKAKKNIPDGKASGAEAQPQQTEQNEQSEKPTEKKKTTVKRGGRKSSKATENSSSEA